MKVTHWQGQFDMHHISTHRGAISPFAPPEDWTGDADGYRALLRTRYRADPCARQQMIVVAIRLSQMEFSGPWAVQARAVIESIREKLRLVR